MAKRPGLTSAFRWLGGLSQFRLGLAYLISFTAATVLYLAGRQLAVPVLAVAGAVLTVATLSVLFNVVTWYRSDNVVNAALFLALVSTLGYSISTWIVIVALSGGSRQAMVFAAGGFFSLPVRVLVATFVFAALVALGRRFRSIFAPGTMPPPTGLEKGAA